MYIACFLLVLLISCLTFPLSKEESTFREKADKVCRDLGGEPSWHKGERQAGCRFYIRPDAEVGTVYLPEIEE